MLLLLLLERTSKGFVLFLTFVRAGLFCSSQPLKVVHIDKQCSDVAFPTIRINLNECSHRKTSPSSVCLTLIIRSFLSRVPWWTKCCRWPGSSFPALGSVTFVASRLCLLFRCAVQINKYSKGSMHVQLSDVPRHVLLISPPTVLYCENENVGPLQSILLFLRRLMGCELGLTALLSRAAEAASIRRQQRVRLQPTPVARRAPAGEGTARPRQVRDGAKPERSRSSDEEMSSGRGCWEGGREECQLGLRRVEMM